jgi:hypothetical protein
VQLDFLEVGGCIAHAQIAPDVESAGNVKCDAVQRQVLFLSDGVGGILQEKDVEASIRGYKHERPAKIGTSLTREGGQEACQKILARNNAF